MKKFLLLLIFQCSLFFAQIPQGYYDSTAGLSGYPLKSALQKIISKNTINWNYGDLPNFYSSTDLDRYYDHGISNTQYLLDLYSEKPNGIDAYEYTATQLISSSSAEGMGYNREHIMPQSTFYSNYPMYSDLFSVLPTDARINQLRSNYPYGISSTNPSDVFYIFTNGSKIGKSNIPNYVYTGRVYEPIDEFKGDIARILFYFAVRYQKKLSDFKFNSSTVASSDTNPLDGTLERSFDPQYLQMLLQWHTQDPVSQYEIDRNNAVYQIQKNRNPFVDFPQWVSSIWIQNNDVLLPNAPTSLVPTSVGENFVVLNWAPSTSTDVVGYTIFANGITIGKTSETHWVADHLSASTNYQFSVLAYDNAYLESPISNILSVSTLANDAFSKDLYISKYIEGTGNNKAIEITNRTGHTVNLDDYRLSIQFLGSAYYFPAPFELEGKIENNATMVIIHPLAQLSCFSNQMATFQTAAPQMGFSGAQYLELRHKSTTIDALGIKDQSNTSTLANQTLYRKNTITEPTANFNVSEWNIFPSDYCENLGVLRALETENTIEKIQLYPNPTADFLYLSGTIDAVKNAKIIDFSGKIFWSAVQPFKNKNHITVSHLVTGKYLLILDETAFSFIKK